MSRDAKDLTDSLKDKYYLLVQKMKEQGYEVILTCAYRSGTEQAQLYAIGRTISPGHAKLTDKQPGQSKHNFLPARAFDIAISMHGKLLWDPESPPWLLARQIGHEIGLKNLYPFESCHWEDA